MKQKVEIKIPLSGPVTVHVICGIEGPACKTLTKSIQGAIGKTVSSQTTDDYYKQPKLLHNQK